MVLTNDGGSGDRQFVIRPTRSLTWRQAQLFFLSLAIPCLGVGAGCALLGFWPVLPFAGAEVGLLGACIYLSALSGREVEMVRVSRETVAVEKGREEPRETWQFTRAWARIDLRPAPVAWHPSRLLIGSHGKLVQLGAFLTEEERRQLAVELRRAIAQPGGRGHPNRGQQSNDNEP